MLAAGVPLNFALPFPLSEKVTPDGRAPTSEMVGAGDPLAATVNEPADPTLKLALFALVNAGPWLTFSVKLWEAAGATPLAAVKVRLNTPPAVGVPANVPVPSWLSAKVTPLGKAPTSVVLAAGNPDVVTLNEPEDPVWKAVLLELVIEGAWLTVRVKV